MFGQLPDTKQYLKRVKDAGGTVRNDVQIALNNFTKKIYKEGLRSTNGGSHIVKHCNVFATETKTGSKFNLWFVGNAINHDDNGYTYSLANGASIFDVINTNFNTTDISLNDGHMGWFITEPYADVALIGYNNGTGDRLMCHPNGYGGFYMDWGSTASDGRSLYSISDSSVVLGLDIATKLGSQARHVLNGVVVKTTTLATNKSVSAGNFIFNTYNSGGAYTDLRLGGFTFGADIPNAKLATYRDTWISLQETIAPERSPSFTPPIPAPKLWFDGSDVSTMLTTGGSAVSNGGFVRTWLDKSGNGKTIETDSSSFTLQYTSGQGIKFLAGSAASSFSRADGFYFGTVAFVFTSDDNHSSTGTTVRGLLGHSNGSSAGFEGIVFGSKTSWLDNEVLSFLGDGRLGIVSTSLTFSAGSRYCVILSRTGNRTGLAKVNSTNYTPQPANASGGNANLSFYNNVAFKLGSNNAAATSSGGEKFRGFIHEFRNYSEAFNQNEIDLLAAELMAKWSI